MPLRPLPALALALALAPGPGAAQSGGPIAAPACVPEREGLTACLAGKLCDCRFEPGGSLTGRPSGYRWDCGTLRPPCGDALAVAPQQSLPAEALPSLFLAPPWPPGPGFAPGPMPRPPLR